MAPDPTFVATLAVAGVVCLTPLGIYLVWLATVNRRGRPAVVAGGWDFAALVAGLSGFVLFGGLLLLTFARSNLRHLFDGNLAALHDAWGRDRQVWAFAAGAYLLGVAGVVALGVLGRARSLSVYNCDGDRAEAVVEGVLADVGVPARRFGNVWADGPAVVAIDDFPALRHVTLRVLTSDPRLAEELARGFRLRLAALASPPNPIARWFALGSFACLAVLSCSVLLCTVFLLLAIR